jgi:hypothetical protein
MYRMCKTNGRRSHTIMEKMLRLRIMCVAVDEEDILWTSLFNETQSPKTAQQKQDAAFAAFGQGPAPTILYKYGTGRGHHAPVTLSYLTNWTIKIDYSDLNLP